MFMGLCTIELPCVHVHVRLCVLFIDAVSFKTRPTEREEAEVWIVAVQRDKGLGSGHQGDIINEIKPHYSVVLLLPILSSPI